MRTNKELVQIIKLLEQREVTFLIITPQLNFLRKLSKISQLNLGFCSSLKALAFVDTAYLISVRNMIIFSRFIRWYFTIFAIRKSFTFFSVYFFMSVWI